MYDFMKLYTGPPEFEFGRVEFASGGPGGPPVSKVNVEPWAHQTAQTHRKSSARSFDPGRRSSTGYLCALL